MRGERERLSGRLTISTFSRSHVSYKFDKFWTVSDGRKLRRISTIVDSIVKGLQGTIAFTPTIGPIL